MKLRITAVAAVCLAIAIILGGTMTAKAYAPDANAPRSSVPAQYKWQLAPVFKSDAAWESAYKEARGRFAGFERFRGKLSDPATLAKCLAEFFSIQQAIGKLMSYSDFKHREDMEVGKYEKMFQRALALTKDFSEKGSFLRRELLKMDDAKLKKIMDDKALSPYRGWLSEMTRRKAHSLGDEAEEVMTIMGDNLWASTDLNELPSDTEMVFKSAMRDMQLPKIKDEEGKDVQLTLSNYPKYRSSKDRKVRQEAVAAFFAALKKYQNILSSTLGGEMKRDVNLARARKYDHAVDAYLDMDNLTSPVVDNLVNTVNANLKPLHRYVELRKKLLGLKDLHIYDLYTPLVPSVEAKVPYEKAVQDTTDAVSPLGNDYVKAIKTGLSLKDGWTDVYPNKGKESGAFCSSVYGIHPYIFLNYLDDIDSASTLAHEFGHAMHSHFNMEANSYVNAGYATILAEIASTMNETLFTNKLLEEYKDNDEMRLYLLGERLENLRTTIYRQTLFAEFERKLHDFAEKGTPLTSDLFNETYKGLIKKYYGPGFTVDADDDIEWAYIPHFYWKFYVFSYATGLSAGIAFADKIETEGAPARERYLAMLKEPAYNPPLETLSRAGMDLTKPGVIKAALDLMDKTITEIEKIAAKAGISHKQP